MANTYFLELGDKYKFVRERAIYKNRDDNRRIIGDLYYSHIRITIMSDEEPDIDYDDTPFGFNIIPYLDNKYPGYTITRFRCLGMNSPDMPEDLRDKITAHTEDYDICNGCWDDNYGWIDCMLCEEGWENDNQVELWIYNYDFSVSLYVKPPPPKIYRLENLELNPPLDPMDEVNLDELKCDGVIPFKFKPPSLFSTSFEEAKSKFEDHLCNNWVIKRINNNETTIAVLQNPNSNHWVIHTSGIHGVEGYTGSAIQLRILKELKSKPDNIPNIMLVHAMNPSGMKTMQRVNHNNVDLNRNNILNNDFTSDSAVFKDRFLNALINPNTLFEFYMFPILIIYSLLVYGLKKSVQLVVTGQYQNQSAMSYGGTRHEPEIKEFFKAIAPFFNDQTTITHIDLHTGFGKYLNEYLMVDTRNEQNYFERFLGKCNYYINSEYPEYKQMKGGLINGFQPLLELYGNIKIQSYHGMVQEFGTVNSSGIPIFIKMRYANFIQKYHKQQVEQSREAMYNIFNPPSAEYREQCISSGWKRFSELLK